MQEPETQQQSVVKVQIRETNILKYLRKSLQSYLTNVGQSVVTQNSARLDTSRRSETRKTLKSFWKTKKKQTVASGANARASKRVKCTEWTGNVTKNTFMQTSACRWIITVAARIHHRQMSSEQTDESTIDWLSTQQTNDKLPHAAGLLLSPHESAIGR